MNLNLAFEILSVVFVGAFGVFVVHYALKWFPLVEGHPALPETLVGKWVLVSHAATGSWNADTKRSLGCVNDIEIINGGTNAQRIIYHVDGQTETNREDPVSVPPRKIIAELKDDVEFYETNPFNALLVDGHQISRYPHLRGFNLVADIKTSSGTLTGVNCQMIRVEGSSMRIRHFSGAIGTHTYDLKDTTLLPRLIY